MSFLSLTLDLSASASALLRTRNDFADASDDHGPTLGAAGHQGRLLRPFAEINVVAVRLRECLIEKN